MQNERTIPVVHIEQGSFKATFAVDIPNNQIKNVAPPFNTIAFTQMDYAMNYEDYIFLIDKQTGEQFHPPKGSHCLPDQVIAVKIPNERVLDPEGMKLHHNSWPDWLSEYQQRGEHKAVIVPVAKLGYKRFKPRNIRLPTKNTGNVKKKT
ncbi:hypothetical protein [Chitinophaga sp. 212800010-3]|uniref:hypothetical protein n=1 Tax=unclassified Chitinophaga TaxID=2619133 RepID=UPI002DF134DF|nr:hypothetical protein [Chitinophaga sp. 212800010-3]